jgi:POT family proton-dependent oligopeptide transporter
MWIAAMLFWMVFEQAATTLSRFAEERTELSVAGVHITAEFFQSINPVCIIVLAPVFALLWMARAGKFPTDSQKMSIGLFIGGLSFLMLAWLSATYQAPALTPGEWFGLVYVVQTLGELCLSPVGLAVTTLLAPRAFRSQMMALWFLASAAGQAITAQVVRVTENMADTTYFLMMGCITAGAAVVLFLLAPMMHRHMRDVEHVPADDKVH